MFKSLTLLLPFLFLQSFSSPRESKWVKIESKEYGFKVQFPKEPETNFRTVVSAIGDIEMHSYIYKPTNKEKDQNLVYMVNHNDFPESYANSNRKDELNTFFRNTIDEAVSKVNGTLISEKKIEKNGFPEREYRVSVKNNKAILKCRVYLVNSSLYITQVITLSENEFNINTNRFLDSFELK